MDFVKNQWTKRLIAAMNRAAIIKDQPYMSSTKSVPGGGNLNDAQVALVRQTPDGYAASGTLNVHDANATAISTATTTVVKSGAGQLLRIIVLGGTLGNITVYDNTAASGTLIAAAWTPVALTGNGPAVYEFNVAFTTGLTIVTAAATVLTVTSR